MVLRVSNEKFFDVLDPLPLENTGWEVKVFQRLNPNTLVALVPRWTTISGTKQISDVGVGKVNILRDDRIFTDPLPTGVVSEIIEDETIWKFYWNGIHRFSFYCEDVDKNHVDEQERSVISISGRTTGKILEHGIVLPENYPNHISTDRQYNGISVMAVWLALYVEAALRGAIPPFFNADMTSSEDTSGEPWIDVSNTNVPAGGNLLDLLRRWSQVASVDWQVTKDNKIDVRRFWGSHKEDRVVFHVSGSVLKLKEQQTRRDVKTHLYVEGGGAVVEAGDASSKWGRREAWLNAENAGNSSTASIFANSALESLREENRQIVVKVLPDLPGRVLFVDYDVGDWVTVEFDETSVDGSYRREAMRIISASWAIDENGKMDLELVMNTRMQERLIRIQQALSRLGDRI